MNQQSHDWAGLYAQTLSVSLSLSLSVSLSLCLCLSLSLSHTHIHTHTHTHVWSGSILLWLLQLVVRAVFLLSSHLPLRCAQVTLVSFSFYRDTSPIRLGPHMDRGARWTAVHGVIQSPKRLSNKHTYHPSDLF